MSCSSRLDSARVFIIDATSEEMETKKALEIRRELSSQVPQQVFIDVI